MTPAARLAATIELLDAIAREPRPADALLAAYFRGRRFIGAKDRAHVAQAVYDVLRRRGRIGWWLDRLDAAATPRTLALAAAALPAPGEPPRQVESVAALFSGGRFGAAPLDEAERRLARALEGRTLHHPDMAEAVRVECPPWAEPGLRAAFGPRFATELEALIPQAKVDLRVNALVAQRAEVLARLAADGIAAAPGALSPYAIRLEGRPPVTAHPLTKAGAIEVQDEGSQLAALLVDARPGHQVVDLCAGAGGKTLAMAATMDNRGRVMATDVLGARLERARTRFRRAGIHNIETRALSGLADPWVKRHKAQWDRVLVDAPCSGTGTWRRNPDQRWRSLGPGLASLIETQAALLDSAGRLVKPGGRLAYVTCSLLDAENEAQAAGFLARHPAFRPVSVADVWPQAITARGGGTLPDGIGERLVLTPARHGTDGFFAALFERTA